MGDKLLTGRMFTTREFLTDHGEERVHASSQEREMQIHGSKVGMVWQKGTYWWMWNLWRRTAQRRKRKHMSHVQKFVTDGNEKADELAKEGALLDEGFFLAEARAKTMQQEREDVYAALQHAASFHCSVEQWKDCDELKPKPKEKWFFVEKNKGDKASNGMVCGSRQVSVHEMRKRKHIHEDAKKMHRSEILVKKFGKMVKTTFWGHGEVLIWCRKCSAYARQRMGPKQMNCCKPEQMGTKDFGKMLKRIQVLEDGGEAHNWKIEGQRRKKYEKRVSEASEQDWNERFFGAKRILAPCQRKVMREREEEKEENETVNDKRRCVGSVSVEAFEKIQSRWRRSWELWWSSWGDSWIYLRTSLIMSLRLGWMCRMCLWWLMCLSLLLRWSLSCVMFLPVARIGFFLNRSPFSFLQKKKRAHYCTVTQKEMRLENSQLKAPPPSRRRMMPPTPLQKFVFIVWRGAGALRDGGPGVECAWQNGYCENETLPGSKSKIEGGNWRARILAGSR